MRQRVSVFVGIHVRYRQRGVVEGLEERKRIPTRVVHRTCITLTDREFYRSKVHGIHRAARFWCAVIIVLIPRHVHITGVDMIQGRGEGLRTTGDEFHVHKGLVIVQQFLTEHDGIGLEEDLVAGVELIAVVEGIDTTCHKRRVFRQQR